LDITVCKVATLLWELSCHMGSQYNTVQYNKIICNMCMVSWRAESEVHGVTLHPQSWYSHLYSSKAGIRFSDLKTVTHPGTNWAWPRVTLFMGRMPLTTKPHHQLLTHILPPNRENFLHWWPKWWRIKQGCSIWRLEKLKLTINSCLNPKCQIFQSTRQFLAAVSFYPLPAGYMMLCILSEHLNFDAFFNYWNRWDYLVDNIFKQIWPIFL